MRLFTVALASAFFLTAPSSGWAQGQQPAASPSAPAPALDDAPPTSSSAGSPYVEDEEKEDEAETPTEDTLPHAAEATPEPALAMPPEPAGEPAAQAVPAPVPVSGDDNVPVDPAQTSAAEQGNDWRAALTDDARARHVRLSLGSHRQRVDDVGYAMVDRDDVLRGNAYQLGVHVGRGVALDFDYARASSTAEAFGDALWNRFQEQSFALRGTWSVLGLPVVAPYVTASVGAVLADIRFGSGDGALKDRAAALSWSAAAGVEASSPGDVFVGVFADIGYAWQGDLRFSDASSRDVPGSVDLGALTMRGLAWRWGLRVGARF